jgi:osmoprotectant transport system permease protein
LTQWQILLSRIAARPALLIGEFGLAYRLGHRDTLFFASGGALGVYINQGLKTRDYVMMLGASIIVTVLALMLEGVFALLQWLVVPRGVIAGHGTEFRSRPTRLRAEVGHPATEGK